MTAVDSRPRMLITGINGFVGKRLAAYYTNQDYQVYGIDYPSPTFLDMDVDYKILDISDETAVSEYFANHDFEFVIHCAGIAHQGTKSKPRKELMQVNVSGSRNVFDGAASCPGLKRVVFFSTTAVYDEAQPNLKTNETATCKPIGDYGDSKRLAEQAGLEQYAKTGFPLVILRFCPIYGLERLTDIEKRFKGPFGFYFLVDSGSQTISLCSICNVIEAVDIVLRKEGMIGQTFNVADAQTYSQKEILQTYINALNRPGLIVRIPAILLRLLINVLSILQPSQKRIYQSYFQKLAGETVFDIRKIMAEGYVGVKRFETTISEEF
jgi:nucleoside-diphosphate-sugar epimerase